MIHLVLATTVSSLFVFSLIPGCNRSTIRSPATPAPVSKEPPPPGTFSGATENRVVGVVTDTALRPLDGAVVQVLTGSAHGMSVVADLEGRFTLSSGDFDDATEFRALKPGYVVQYKTRGARCDLCTYWTLSFALAPVVTVKWARS